jgi:hypothetical protein
MTPSTTLRPRCLAPSSELWRREDFCGSDALNVSLPEIVKKVSSQTGWNFDMTPTYVPVDHFQQIIWGDPRVAGRPKMLQRAAASGLVETAWQAHGGGPRFITPKDIPMVAAGMGSGDFRWAIAGMGRRKSRRSSPSADTRHPSSPNGVAERVGIPAAPRFG